MKRIFIIFYLGLLIFLPSHAQQGGELRCNINIVSDKIQGTNKSVFQTLQKALYEFMNNRNWTNHVFLQNEKIECNILVNITDLNGDEYKATVTIQSSRPVWGSSYKSVLMNYIDNNFTFAYTEYQALDFNETTYLSNLTSTFAFYALIIIGFDYDTFSPEGGTEFFKRAETVVNNAQSSDDGGWKPFSVKNNKNRYWLIKNILDKNYQPCRDFMYHYHRLGLDNMDKKPTDAKPEIVNSLDLLKTVFEAKPDPYLYYLQVILDAKGDEFANIFTEGMPDEKSRAYTVLLEIDQSHSTKYDKVMKQSN